MPRLPLRYRHALYAVVLSAMAAAVAPAVRAEAAAARTCRSADLRYPFQEGGPKTFGVFRLRITGGRCPRAHRVARAWMDEFEANVADGRLELPRRVAGFAFRSLPPNAAQTYRLRGTRGATTIRFDYRVPNG